MRKKKNDAFLKNIGAAGLLGATAFLGIRSMYVYEKELFNGRLMTSGEMAGIAGALVGFTYFALKAMKLA